MSKIALSEHFNYNKLIRFTFPTIIMMFFTSIYGVVDGLFVSNCVGKSAFAAINLVMPFVMIIGGMGFMVGAGGTALVAKVLGEKDEPLANRYFSMFIEFTFVMAVVLSALGFIFMPQVAKFLKATDSMMQYCVSYGRIVIAFSAAFMFQNLFQSFLIVAARPKLGLFITVAAGVTNIILDAIFVGWFRWGVEGAAYATGISQCVGGLLPLLYFILPNDTQLHFKFVKFEFKPILNACTNGASELMSNISGSIMGMVYNYQLLRIAGEDGVSAYGVLMYSLFIFVSIFIGYSVGSAPIIGYHFGAENKEELHSLLKKSILLIAIIGVLLTVLCMILASPLSKLFVGYDAELFAMTVRAFRIYSVHFLLCGFNIFISSFFTALNNGKVSAAVSFMRTLVFQMLAVLILPIFFDLDGIWWAITVSEIGALACSTFFIINQNKKYGY